MDEEETPPDRHIRYEDQDDPFNELGDVLRLSPRAHDRARQQMTACLAELRTAVVQARRILAERTPPPIPR